MSITSILSRIQENKITIYEAEQQIGLLRFKEIAEIARSIVIDQSEPAYQRRYLAKRKSPEDLVRIVQASMSGDRSEKRILITRMSDDQLNLLKSEIDPPIIEWNERARTLVCGTAPLERTGGRIGIIITTTGTADIPVAEETRVAAEERGCDVVMIIDSGAAGIHRLFPDLGTMVESGVDAIVIAAGLS